MNQIQITRYCLILSTSENLFIRRSLNCHQIQLYPPPSAFYIKKKKSKGCFTSKKFTCNNFFQLRTQSELLCFTGTYVIIFTRDIRITIFPINNFNKMLSCGGKIKLHVIIFNTFLFFLYYFYAKIISVLINRY